MSCDGKAADSEEEKRIQKVNNKEASNIQAIKSFRKALPDASMEHLYCKSKVKETFLSMDQAHSQGVRSMMTLWLRHPWTLLGLEPGFEVALPWFSFLELDLDDAQLHQQVLLDLLLWQTVRRECW